MGKMTLKKHNFNIKAKCQSEVFLGGVCKELFKLNHLYLFLLPQEKWVF